MKRIILTILIIVSMSLAISHEAVALNQNTHGAINNIVAFGNFNNFSLNSYLINNINMTQGTDTVIDNETIDRWIRLGGIYEDDRPVPLLYPRSYNHFHDPTKPLDEAGFTDKLLGWIPLHEGVSSIIWALSEDEQSGTPGLGDYSWPAARNYFYDALTATDQTTRDHNFAKCFRSVGQLMHLVEDASVPEHTRNTAHVSWNYESWVVNEKNSSIVNTILNSTPVVPYDTVLASPGYPEFGGLPVSRLFDTDSYTGQNPDITTNADMGLAEYSNANFFSNDDVFNYNFPADATLQEYSEVIQDPRDPPNAITRSYYLKSGDGEPVDHIAARAYLDYEYDQYEVHDYYDGAEIFLDEYCYQDYATKLLPRAVGYAFSLMQYFFRGEIDAVEPVTLKDGNGNITGVSMKKVVNNTPKIGGAAGEIEPIGGGTDDRILVSYQYTSGGQTVFGNSTSLSFNNNSTQDLVFSGFTPPIPSDATDKKYLLVYRGKLGEEEDAVAAKKFKTGLERPIVGYDSEGFLGYGDDSPIIWYLSKFTSGYPQQIWDTYDETIPLTEFPDPYIYTDGYQYTYAMCADDQYVYTAGFIWETSTYWESPETTSLVIRKYDLSSHTQIWSKEEHVNWPVGDDSDPFAPQPPADGPWWKRPDTILVDDTGIYIAGCETDDWPNESEGSSYAWVQKRGLDGTFQWENKYVLPFQWHPYGNGIGTSAGIALGNGKLYISSPESIYEADKSTGQTIRTITSTSPTSSYDYEPIAYYNGYLYGTKYDFGSTSMSVRKIDISDGTTVWETPTGVSLGSVPYYIGFAKFFGRIDVDAGGVYVAYANHLFKLNHAGTVAGQLNATSWVEDIKTSPNGLYAVSADSYLFRCNNSMTSFDMQVDIDSPHYYIFSPFSIALEYLQ